MHTPHKDKLIAAMNNPKCGNKDREVIGEECAKLGVIYYPTDERSSTGIIEKIKNL